MEEQVLRENMRKLHVLNKIVRVNLLLPISFTVVIALTLSFFVLILQSNNGNSASPLGNVDNFFTSSNVLTVVLVSLVNLYLFLRLLRKNHIFAVKILVATFILSGILSTLLFAKLLFTSLSLSSPIILLVVAVIAYVGAYFAYLVMVEELSKKMKNLLFVVCSGALGSFIGVLLHPVPVMGISLFLSAVDLVLIKRKTVENFLGETAYEKLIAEVAFLQSGWGIGIGDLTCYSIVVSNTSVNFGVITGVASLLLMLTGAFLSLLVTAKKVRIPGLPLSIVLGLLPSIFASIF